MSKIVQNSFGWVDCSSSDVPAATAFYTDLFGWVGAEEPFPDGTTYVTFTKDGKRVAGLGPISTPGFSSTWTSYLMVADAAAVLEAVTAAGGSVVDPAVEVVPGVTVAAFASPSGATLGLLQDSDGEGAELFDAPGSMTWNELSTRDVERDKAFFAEVFGWRWEEVAGSGGYYTAMLDAKSGEDKRIGGLMAMPQQVPADAPSYWGVYFAVDDCAEATVKAVDLGATVFLPPMQMGPGIFAGITDPAGAMLYIGSF